MEHTSHRRRRSIGVAFALLICGFQFLYLLWKLQPYRAPSLTDASNIAGVALIICLTCVVTTSHKGIWSASGMYLTIFGLFHCGLIVVYGLGLLSEQTSAFVSDWFYRDTTPYAIMLVALAIVSYTIGTLLGRSTWVKRNQERSIGDSVTPSYELQAASSVIGLALVAGSAFWWFRIVLQSGGTELLFASYRRYLDLTDGSAAGYAWTIMGFGIVILAASNTRRLQWVGIAIFVGVSIFALPIGLRGEVMFTAVAGLVVHYRNHRPPKAWITFVAIVLVLFAVAAFKEIRQVGVGDARQVVAERDTNILDGLTELGYSLRPTVETVGWQRSGEEFIQGQSYLAPFHRVLCRIAAGVHCLSGDADERNMSVLIRNRVGSIGFSPVAEAYFNFGIYGMVGIMGGIGILLGWMDRRLKTVSGDLLLGVVLLVLLNNTRNAFFVVPYSLAIGGVIVVAVQVLDAYLRQRNDVGVSFENTMLPLRDKRS